MNEELMSLIKSMAQTGAGGLLGMGTSPTIFQDLKTAAGLPQQIKDRASGKKTYREFLAEDSKGMTNQERMGMTLEEFLKEMTEQYKKSPRLQEKPEAAKSIDDIINQSDMVEFLSKAMADKTNVDSSEMPMGADITKYSSDDPLDLLFKMQNNQRREPSNIEGLMKILEDLSKAKPRTS
jgi:hypothetical protein|tara:strand:- start:248 stop:787 length:540 start_codon:yes stop_codon:yes gene_type:complete